ncbi:MAG: phage protein GemA/Gp16 family protein [Oscillospiraceae bacterium]
MATKEQIKRIYGLGAGLGIVGKNRDDMLHELVFACTGKDSIKDLDDADFRRVEGELISRMRYSNSHHPNHKIKSKEFGNNGMATKEQQALCWRFCYRLKELDTIPQSADVGDRLIGAIGKILGVTASKKEPFRWITQNQCAKLIENLKRYVNTAERRAKRQGDKVAGT